MRDEPARLYPWPIVVELTDAARRKDIGRIDQATDRLVSLGLVRPRTDASLFGVGNQAKRNVWANA
jgi:hypothetical protein